MKPITTVSRTRSFGLLALAIALGLAIAWVDSRPHWDDAGITAGMLLLSGGALGMMDPRRAWLWGLAIGIWLPLNLILVQIAAHRVTPRTAGYLVILGFPIAGACAGMAVRKMFASA